MKKQIIEILDRFRQFVTTHDHEQTPILTAYVDVDTTKPENMKERPAWLLDLKNEAKRLQDEIGAERLKRRDAQVKWERAEEMLLSYLQERKPTGRTVVMFTDLENDFVAFDAPVAMTTRLYYGIPQIKHLLFALDQYEKYLVMLFATGETRLVEVFLTRTTGDVTMESEHMQLQRLSRKSLEAGQDRRGPEFERRFVRDMATAINLNFLSDPDVTRLILGGNAQLAVSVKNALHPTIKELVVAVESIDFKTPEIEIARLVKRIADTYEQEHDLSMVDELASRHGRNGAAALGQAAVQAALEQNRAKTLVLPYPIEATQFDQLVMAATIQGVNIEFVSGRAAEKLNELGGSGAYLYYTIP